MDVEEGNVGRRLTQASGPPPGGLRSYLESACRIHGYRKLELSQLEFKSIKNVVNVDWIGPDGSDEQRELPSLDQCQPEMELLANDGSITLFETNM